MDVWASCCAWLDVWLISSTSSFWVRKSWVGPPSIASSVAWPLLIFYWCSSTSLSPATCISSLPDRYRASTHIRGLLLCSFTLTSLWSVSLIHSKRWFNFDFHNGCCTWQTHVLHFPITLPPILIIFSILRFVLSQVYTANFFFLSRASVFFCLFFFKLLTDYFATNFQAAWVCWLILQRL